MLHNFHRECAPISSAHIIYHNLSASDRSGLERVVKSASKLGGIILTSLEQSVTKRIAIRSPKLLTDPNATITLDRLPSGRLRTIKPRTNQMKYCFRATAVHVINKILFLVSFHHLIC